MLVFVKVGHYHLDAVEKSDDQFRYIYSSRLACLLVGINMPQRPGDELLKSDDW